MATEPPIIADVFRCTLNWESLNGVAPRNVFHVSAAAMSVTEVMAVLQANVYDAMFGCMVSEQLLGTITVLPLDGVTAGLEEPPTDPTAGTSEGQVSPASAGLLKIKTLVRGPSARGRMYIGPVAESAMADGVLDPTIAGTMISSWYEAIGAWSTAGLTFGVASYTHLVFHPMASMTIEPLLGTQRRRQDQIRRA